MFCPECGEKLKEKTKICPLCGFKFVDNINSQNNKNKFYFSLFSVLIPFLCFLFIHIIENHASWNENSGVDSRYGGYLGYYVILEFVYIFLYQRVRQTKCLNIFIAHSIIIFSFATLPIFGLFYAFGFIFILPILLYFLVCWILTFTTFITDLFNVSRLFRLCLFGIFIYLIIAVFIFYIFK